MQPDSQAQWEINASDVLLYLCTPSSKISEMVQHEVAYADTVNKPIIPLLVGEIPPGGFLIGREYLKIDLADMKPAFEKISIYVIRYTEKEKSNRMLAILVFIILTVGAAAITIGLVCARKKCDAGTSEQPAKDQTPPPQL